MYGLPQVWFILGSNFQMTDEGMVLICMKIRTCVENPLDHTAITLLKKETGCVCREEQPFTIKKCKSLPEPRHQGTFSRCWR